MRADNSTKKSARPTAIFFPNESKARRKCECSVTVFNRTVENRVKKAGR